MKSDDYPPDAYNCQCVAIKVEPVALDPPWYHPEQSKLCAVIARILGPRITSHRSSDPSNGETYWWQCEHCGASDST